jgi:hypothetical protein
VRYEEVILPLGRRNMQEGNLPKLLAGNKLVAEAHLDATHRDATIGRRHEHTGCSSKEESLLGCKLRKAFHP